MSYVNSKNYKELTDDQRSMLRGQLSKLNDEYCLNEYEVAVLTNLSISTLRKDRSEDRGFPFIKAEPISNISNKPTAASRKRSSSSRVRYPFGRLRDLIGGERENI